MRSRLLDERLTLFMQIFNISMKFLWITYNRTMNDVLNTSMRSCGVMDSAARGFRT